MYVSYLMLLSIAQYHQLKPRPINSLHTLLPGKTRRITYFSSPFCLVEKLANAWNDTKCRFKCKMFGLGYKDQGTGPEKLLRSTSCARLKGQTRHTPALKSTSAGRWRGKPGWSLRSRQSTSSLVEQ